VSTLDTGDVLVYGAHRSIPTGTPLASIRETYPDAAIILAHPYRDGKRPSPERLLNPLIDGVEIFNSNHSASDNVRGLGDWHRYKFTAVAGTDTHGVTYAGTYPTHFDHPVETVGELVEALKQGSCRPLLVEIPKSKEHVRMGEVTFGIEQAKEAGEKVIIREFRNPEEWPSGERAFHVMSEIRRHGFAQGKFRVPEAIGKDSERMTTIEQSFRGVSLYEKVIASDTEQARSYVRLSAQWLARLHNLRLQITPPGDFLEAEMDRMRRHVRHFEEIGHSYTDRIREIAETLVKAERDLFEGRLQDLVQGHGDYQPKNIFIGLEKEDDPGSAYVGVIDFDRSSCLPRAFDVGYFLAQFRNQLFDHPDVLRDTPEDVFLEAYLSIARQAGADFLNQVELFRARGDLGIASFLVQIGLGASENLWRVLVEAERALTRFEAGRT